MKWGTIALWLLVSGWIVAPVFFDLSMKWLAAGYQFAGTVLALLGVGVITDHVQRAAARVEVMTVAIMRHAAAARRRVRAELRRRWAMLVRRISRLRGRATPAYMSATSAATSDTAGSLGVTKNYRPRPDPVSTSEREWLARLDADVVGLIESVDRINVARGRESEEVQQRLHAQAIERRAEITNAVRSGWQLVVAGLVLTGVGSLLSGWA